MIVFPSFPCFSNCSMAGACYTGPLQLQGPSASQCSTTCVKVRWSGQRHAVDPKNGTIVPLCNAYVRVFRDHQKIWPYGTVPLF